MGLVLGAQTDNHCGSLQIHSVSLQLPKPGVRLRLEGLSWALHILSVALFWGSEMFGRPALYQSFLEPDVCHQQLFLCGATLLRLDVKGLPLSYLGQKLPWPQEFFSEMSLWWSWGWLARQSHCPSSMLVDQIGQLKKFLKMPPEHVFFLLFLER